MLDEREDILDFDGGLALGIAREIIRQHRLYLSDVEEFLEGKRATLTETLSNVPDERAKLAFIGSKYPHLFEGTFQGITRSSFVVSLFSYVEFLLDHVCRDFKKVLNTNISHKDFWGSSLDKSRTFLTKLAEFKNPSPAQWDAMSRLHDVRNILVHSGGFLDGARDMNKVEKVVSENKGIECSEEMGYLIQSEYCTDMLKMVDEFIISLQEEAKAICGRVKRFEKRV